MVVDKTCPDVSSRKQSSKRKFHCFFPLFFLFFSGEGRCKRVTYNNVNILDGGVWGARSF